MQASSADLPRCLRGRFIVFDGPDGAGKSTQRQRLAQRLEAEGLPVVSCRDPGGTQIGDRIRSVLLDFDLSTMDVSCETLLFMASRAQLVAEVIRPALAAGKTVLCDRFVTSTCAYQGAAGYDPKRVIELARYAIGDCWPCVTLLFDVDPKEGFARIGRKPHHAGRNRRADAGDATLFSGSRPDAMEARSLEFHRQVREMFLGVGTYYPTPVVVIDGRGDAHAVESRVWEALAHVAW
ncbi:MAG: dTMP kinase [Planctomycetes bacterium]|nr:dTMP kinase [Planctomycetota bacterium]